jgi:hypothetical protein
MKSEPDENEFYLVEAMQDEGEEPNIYDKDRIPNDNPQLKALL